MTFRAFARTILERGDRRFYGAGPTGFKRLMQRLGNPQNSYQIIHVAGTNGKGSVCYLCAEILKAAGYKTGLFISPHLHHITERIQINGHKISQADFKRLCKQVFAAEEKKLNFFEFITAVAFLYFAEKKVDWVVLETGLGGGKDPTNICKPAACVLSSIGLDHCHILGNTLSQIAREKAGIIKKNIPVFCPPLPPKVMQEICTITSKKHAPLYVIKQGQPFELAGIDWQKADTILQKGAARWRFHLLGEKQVQNACLVYQVCRTLNIPERAIKQGLARVRIPARFEIIHFGERTLILDGAHNPQAMENLMKFLQKSPWKKHLAVACGFMCDKDYPTMLRILNKQGWPVYIADPLSLRAATSREIKAALPRGMKIKYSGFPMDVLPRAFQKYQTVLVTGSFYLMSNVRNLLKYPVKR
ncbi:MAG: bifunctional folylpolyglutamate synthase/dihydrofolate synthase [Elusimicrobiaceae bacterium]|nr:bifunctional folylpolyglutamate synthase/dihydrofolate synthase [Elusimicrobiaceae bacterium]